MEHFPATMTRAESDQMVDVLTEILIEKGRGFWASEVKARVSSSASSVWVLLAGRQRSLRASRSVGAGQQAWGHGYAPEGARAALAFGFQNVELPNDEIVSFTTRPT